VNETPEPQEEAVEEPEATEAQAEVAGLPLEPAESAASRLEEQFLEAQDRYLRLAAEFDNFRKRVARERAELADRAQASLVGRLLDVLDDLDRLAAQDISQSGTDVLHEALVLLDRKFRKELESAGLARIDPAGSAFDPSVHEAVSVMPTPDPALDQQVSATFQTGYLFKGALVRPARVQVYSSQA
jgi:molecular chaperone GrpE